ncbi:MAG: hypothetical protein HOI53_01435, partial [Francisellaceae bacterium]|nr:hypothetical protein [Francisellaceae bacterium]
MNISNNILDYWREASILSILNSSLQSPKLTLLSKDIISSNTIDDIHPSRVYLAPISIQHKDANIYPYFIPCDLSSTGKIDVTGVTSEDILISKALEKVFSGGSDYLLQQLQFSQEEFSSLDEVFLFCTQLLEDIPDIDFKDSKCAIFVHDDLANLVRESLLLKTKTNPHEVYVSMDNELNSYIYLGHTSNKFTLSKQPKDFLNRLHTMMNKQVLLVDAVPGSGALEAVRSFTIDAWVKSAITNSPLPKYYHYDKENVRLSHIFANDDSGWLSYDIQLELVNNTDELDNIESISKSYIKKSNTFFNKQAMTVEEVLRYLHRLLNQQVNKLKEGITLKYIYNEMKTKIDHKYEKHTDINTRKNRLMVYLAAAREELNEVKVLLSFWQRQVSQMPFYYKN